METVPKENTGYNSNCAMEIIQFLEKRCKTTIASKHLRSLIHDKIQQLIDKNNDLRIRMVAVLQGDSTYNPNDYRLHTIPESKEWKQLQEKI